ncbi:uncharacterized protein METZ01_LOCUS50658 [marine metagenome]|uniref:Uncharacterized protein n=1 Tax=marine metagenome TaxID=408172 RepID=A0A381S2Y3_9ZZZZ
MRFFDSINSMISEISTAASTIPALLVDSHQIK